MILPPHPRHFTIIMGLVLFTAVLSFAQTAVTETTATTATTTATATTNLAGTISEFGPDVLVIRSEAQPAPVRYTYTKTTTYVDEAGVPVSMETVKSGLPVTVYYTKVGDKMVASKVMVRKVVVKPAPAPVVEEKKTTTTTVTTDKK